MRCGRIRPTLQRATQRWPGPKTARCRETRRREGCGPCRRRPPSPTPTRSAAPSSPSPTTSSSTATRPRPTPPVEEFHRTRIILDIEGNQREVIDAKDRVVMRYDYDMLGNRVHQASMEAGERWMLNDVAGKPLYAWDSRDHRFRTAYDPLRRPTDSFLREGAGAEMRRRAQRLRRDPPEPRGEQPARQGGRALRSGRRRHQRRLRLQGQPAAQPAPSWPQSYKTTLDWSGAVPLQARDLHQPHALRRAQPPDPVDRAAQRPARCDGQRHPAESTTRPTCWSRCTPGSTGMPSPRAGSIRPPRTCTRSPTSTTTPRASAP